MILSIDAGYRSTGYTIFNFKEEIIDFGVIKTSKSQQKQKRVINDHFDNAKYITATIKNIITERNIKILIGELPSGGGKSARAMSAMNMITAIIASCCELLEIPSEFTSPSEVKFVMTGSKIASKEEVMIAVQKKYPDINFPKAKCEFEHIADSIGAFHVLKNCDIIRLFKNNIQPV